MNSKRWVLLAFIAGVGVGSVCTWQLLKRKYEQIAQEEIDSVKAVYVERKNVEKAEKSFLEGLQEGLKKKETQDNEDLKEYKSIIQKEGYTDYSRRVEEKKGDLFTEKPYVILPEEFGEFEDYEKISLTYYADKVLADENDEEVDDVDENVGEESLNHFGEYEDDSVFVRNDRLKCDYEILLDQRNYYDVTQTNHIERRNDDEEQA